MSHIEIPCLFMRAGTSRGPFFDAADLPADKVARNAMLVSALGSNGVGCQLDGLGGGSSLTSKVAIVARSTHPDADIDYSFVQVATDGSYVDDSPACGNMLSGVGPFAIERGLVPAADGETTVRIRDRNTGSFVNAVVQTPGGRVVYAGDAQIDGVPGTAAPITLNFSNVVGAKTGKMLPTGSSIDVIEGVPVTCIDVATPMILISAASLGLTGYETPEALSQNASLFAVVERIRLEAGRRMGLGDVSGKVLPKVALLAAPKAGGTISSRYLTPWTAHAAHAVTGAICVASACAIAGTVAAEIAAGKADAVFDIEHPAGKISIVLRTLVEDGQVSIAAAGLLRTARLLMRGSVVVAVPDVQERPMQIAA